MIKKINELTNQIYEYLQNCILKYQKNYKVVK